MTSDLAGLRCATADSLTDLHYGWMNSGPRLHQLSEAERCGLTAPLLKVRCGFLEMDPDLTGYGARRHVVRAAER